MRFYPLIFLSATVLGAFVLLAVSVSYADNLFPLLLNKPWELALIVSIIATALLTLWMTFRYQRPSKVVRLISNVVLIAAGFMAAIAIYGDYTAYKLVRDGVLPTGEAGTAMPFYPALGYLIVLSLWGRTKQQH